MRGCKHCQNGWFDDQRYGQDVECVNGVLIDIDVAHDGWSRDTDYPLAPCHPKFKSQNRRGFRSDCQERLEDWASVGRETNNG